ncbi:MFS transporter [Arthrobacter sp. zg-Y916]|uniref:Lysosomal dipeptide transporter MFSD1 n=1 Tax=Arthrobacter caoxuetaonis TaxID=2886935 RepID=A0A9X1MHP7_9MICC|nr:MULTISPECIES: MFS transporter [Arthrobacter]MCC3299107.1 MFS transporter [Arthrobacter caoxuetaonis]MCC9193188.1 MFS transporter [Arthrobacter sp. zg-Y916]USQ58560.1 MFS transporter [Arthrobacter caoxuetaonis]
MKHRGAWLVWGAGVFAYMVAVTQRTAFGVAGVEATDRFDATASVLSVFTVVQLLVYAGLQIPVGMLVDRFGPRLLIAGGAALMCAGQFQLAVADSVGAGIAGRSLVGAGDALTFISVLRLLPAWFPPARVPVLTQWTGIIGQLGQIASAIPFAFLLRSLGWSTAFTGAAALSVLALILSLVLIRNKPSGPRPAAAAAGGPESSLAAAWRQPGTRLGLWTHFTIQFPGTVFVLMWGYPYLVSGEQVSAPMASFLMTFFVTVAILCGPWLGAWVGRHPLRRSTMVLLIAGAMAAAWLAVMLWPGPAPVWLLLLLVSVLAIGGPGSMIGFDFARTFNPASRLGTATGIVNIGGFAASLISMYLIGLVLDMLYAGGFSNGNLYDLTSFRIALAVQFAVMLVGIAGIFRTRRIIRARMASEGLDLPPLREALARERQRRRSQRRSSGQEGTTGELED